MKTIIPFALFIFDTVCAARDWSKITTRVAPGFSEEHQIVDLRIVGGEEAIPNSIPYQAGLFIEVARGIAFCGGSLISTKYVLTAAHCADDAISIQVVLGAHNIRDDEPPKLILEASKIIVHNGWNYSTLTNDIALVELSEEVPLSDAIKPVGLPKYSEVDTSFYGETVKVSGWGRDSDKARSISSVLRYVDVEVITNSACKNNYIRFIKSTNICTSGKWGMAPCNGDSGGPLVIGNKQIGVVSFGISIGCEKRWPSAYTRLTKYLDWISDNTDIIIQY